MAYTKADWAPEGCPDKTWVFDRKRAEKVIAFIERFCTFPEGFKAGKPFKLLDWQKDEVVTPLFGTVRWSEEQQKYIRQYRLAWIEVARKNGKSTFMAAVALYLTGFDGEENAQVYSVAGSIKQAAQVFRAAANMVKKSPELQKHFKVLDATKTIVHGKSGSRYTVISSDGDDALGTNQSAVIFDEVVVQKSSDLWDALRTGMGARSQPLFIGITTAGPIDSAKFCLEEHDVSERVLEDPMLEPTRFVFMRNTPADADWRDEANWFHANPSLGQANSLESMRELAREAENKPAAQNKFRMLNLNTWTSQMQRWLDMRLWDLSDASGGPVVEELLRGRKCFGGLDLSYKQDMTAWVLLFPGSPTDEDADGFTVLPRFWIPREAIEKHEQMEDKLLLWEEEGWLTVTPEFGVDLEVVQQQVIADTENFYVVGIGNDPFNAQQMVQNIERNGTQVFSIPQNAARLNEPTLLLEELVADKKIFAGFNPVLRWHVENVKLTKPDKNANVRPQKGDHKNKIDGVVALVHGLAVSLLNVEDETSPNFYSFYGDDE